MAVVLALLAVTSASAFAQSQDSKAKAEAKVDEASRYSQERNYEDALEALRQASDLYPSPKLHFNFGQLFRKLGRDGEALESFQTYLAKDKDPERAAEASRAIAELSKNLGALVIECAVSGAAIMIDGQPRGRTPRGTIYLPPGNHQVAVYEPGRSPEQSNISITVEQTHTLAACTKAAGGAPLAPVRASPPAASTQAAAVPPGSRRAAELIDPYQPAAAVEASSRPDLTRPAAWATGGAAVLSLGLGLMSHLKAMDRAQQFDDLTGPASSPPAMRRKICGEDEPDRGGSECRRLYDDASSAQKWAIVGYGLGVGLGAVSGYLFWRSQAQTEGARSAALTCGPTLPERGVRCRLAF